MMFDGNFDLLPLRSELTYGVVPEYPTSSEFHLASSVVAANEDDAAAHWYLEAIRERRNNPGRSLNEAKAEINQRVAARLYAITRQ